MIHPERHPQSGLVVRLGPNTKDRAGRLKPGTEFLVDDWADRLLGRSWVAANGNPAALLYAMRIGLGCHVPLDDEVIYGHVGSVGALVHASELDPGDA